MAQENLKFLQPEKLAIDPSSSFAEDDWKFWFKTFSNFINALPGGENALKKLNVLTAHLTVPLYKLIQEETTYERAIETLQKLFVKPRNEIYARHLLATARQNIGESINAHALVDIGSTNSYICKNFAKQHGLNYKSIKFAANMANSSLKTEICGMCYLNLTFVGNFYKNFKFHVMPNLICDAIIGDNLL